MRVNLADLALDIARENQSMDALSSIEKEVVHYEIFKALYDSGLLSSLTFQGGTSLRLCYGSKRYSEDLDFCAGEDFSHVDLEKFAEALNGKLLRSFDSAVSIKSPKAVPAVSDDIGVLRWRVNVDTKPSRPDLPMQRIKIEVASVPSYTRSVHPMSVNYDALPCSYGDILIPCETLGEIAADKIFSFAATESHIRYRDIWDLAWIAVRDPSWLLDAVRLVPRKHEDYRCDIPLGELLEHGRQKVATVTQSDDFENQMKRFLTSDACERADFSSVGRVVEDIYGSVGKSLGLSGEMERCRREAAHEAAARSLGNGNGVRSLRAKS